MARQAGVEIPANVTWEAEMTSATMRKTRGASRGEGYWMVVFAASLLGVVGVFNLIDGIAAVARSHVFIGNAHYVIGDLRAWGWVVLILGVLQLAAMHGVLACNQIARCVGAAVIGVNAIAQKCILPGLPLWSRRIVGV